MRTIMVILISFAFLALPAQADTNCLENPTASGCRAGLPEADYEALLAEMENHPTPNVTPLEPNLKEINRYAYWRLNVPGGVTIYNAPNGSPSGRLDPGYHLITAYSYQQGWVEINPGQWVKDDEHVYGVHPSKFTGVFLDQENPYPMGWILEDSTPIPYPGGEPDASAEPIKRYTLVNIYHAVEFGGWQWYLIAPDHWIVQKEIARILLTNQPAEVEGIWVGVDLFEQVLVVYQDEKPVFATLISSGLERFPTNEGLFQVQHRVEDAPMSGAEGQSDFYRLENVLWSMYFDGRISLHGTYWHDGFGYRQSHGCVNMSITDANWLYEWSAEQGPENFWVYVYSTGEYKE